MPTLHAMQPQGLHHHTHTHTYTAHMYIHTRLCLHSHKQPCNLLHHPPLQRSAAVHISLDTPAVYVYAMHAFVHVKREIGLHVHPCICMTAYLHPYICCSFAWWNMLVFDWSSAARTPVACRQTQTQTPHTHSLHGIMQRAPFWMICSTTHTRRYMHAYSHTYIHTAHAAWCKALISDWSFAANKSWPFSVASRIRTISSCPWPERVLLHV